MNNSRYCDGMTRRDFLKVGAIGSLSLSDFLRCTQGKESTKAKAKSAIFIFLGGGPSHLDTFDLKPASPMDVRGEFTPISTNVTGLSICEHLPRLAKYADKYAIVRGVSHTLAGHQLGTEYLSTGNRPIPSLEFPGYGAVVSKELSGSPELPHFVAIPNTPQQPGYLGIRYASLRTNSTPSAGKPFSVRGISLGNGITVDQFQKRQKLLDELDTTFKDIESNSSLIDGLDQFSRQAYAMISSPRARKAFDVSQEKSSIAEAFGKQRFGQSCLLAARLIEAGTRFVTVTFSGWDTHSGNFRKMKDSLLPQFDEGLSALLTTLDNKGLLESTTVCVTGEFGRTPKINPGAGRDHWPRSMCVLFAGGGIKAGQVLGASDAKGMGPTGQPITPDQIAATFYQTLGIDHQKEYHTNTGRPVMIVREGKVIPELVN